MVEGKTDHKRRDEQENTPAASSGTLARLQHLSPCRGPAGKEERHQHKGTKLLWQQAIPNLQNPRMYCVFREQFLLLVFVLIFLPFEPEA